MSAYRAQDKGMGKIVDFLPPLIGIVGMGVAYLLYGMVMKYDEGTDAIKKIGDQIHEGAMVFMKREYKILILFLIAQIIVTFIFLGGSVAFAVLVGAVSSSIAGWIGMYAATKANVRTATAAQADGASSALTVAFFGGSIMGLSVGALGLIGLGGLYVIPAGSVAVSLPKLPTWALTSWVRLRPESPKMILGTPALSQIT